MFVKIIKKEDVEEYDINDLVEKLKNNVNIDKCGAIFTFEGFVRGSEENKLVDKMKLTTPDVEKTEKELIDLAEEVIGKYSIEDVSVVHYVGEFYTGDPLFLVAVMGHHRQDTLKALTELIERTKFDLDFKKEELSNQGNKIIMSGG